MNIKVCLSSIGRFHFYPLARELNDLGILELIYTGYPKSMVEKNGIPSKKIRSFPWMVAPRMAASRFVNLPDRFLNEYDNISQIAHDNWVSKTLVDCDIFHGLSRYNIKSGKKAKSLGAKYVCEVGSAHILSQQEILAEQYKRVGLEFSGFHPSGIARELEEYESADKIFVLSSFAKRSFLENGISDSKISCIPPGVNLERFNPGDRFEEHQSGKFQVLFVGRIGVRKGVHVLASAFKKAALPNSELILVGAIEPGMEDILSALDVPNLRIEKSMPNAALGAIYRTASVFVLPSFEDGFGMVALEAMASGCPAIVSEGAGAADAVSEGINGFVVPAGDIAALAERLAQLYEDRDLAREMGKRACEIVHKSRSWKDYTNIVANHYAELLN